ncbi:MAG: hypothetical protein JO307_06755 [Bryobacterales bacterium]|nr:hypothetical protein [Bryobacterales bacterium]MBV9399592.1 hypothetical protein [Bryobacterales bacterium]
MKTIIVRNLPPGVTRAVLERARRDRSSLNAAVIRLLEERLGAPGQETAGPIHHDLDFLYGTWTPEEADIFDQDLAAQRAI